MTGRAVLPVPGYPSKSVRGRPIDPSTRLADGIAALQLQLPADAETRLLAYLGELERWNSAFNLTAVREPMAMVTRHLLDSLATLPVVEEVLQTSPAPALIDVGTGAGLPAIPLAIARPQWRVVALDSNGKKARFLRHAQRALALDNLTVVEGRCEALRPEPLFDAVISRAFAALGDFLRLSDQLASPAARWLAMKGRPDNAEMNDIPPAWRLERTVPLQVPGLDEARQLLVLARRPQPAA